jgi:hypothetical protein
MLPRIHRSDIHQWWEKNCDAFIWKEAELRGKSVKDTREVIFYSERSSDQYEIFWVKFLEELFHWIERLQEALEFQERVKKTCTWDTKNIAVLHRLDRPITRAVDFWVNTTLEGYIIEFAAENHQSFSREEEDFKKYTWGRLLERNSPMD